ncbi:hypothetical protein KY346_06590 [Candidatus Woesearchaeota archaeon]|nr:hypothetical protein [Candidatus Woesearchaeota archaeon]
MRKIPIILIFLAILLAPLASAADIVLVNSDNWMDIYSGAIYSQILGKKFKFLISEKHSAKMPQYISKKDLVTVVESEKLPFMINYADTLSQQGYTVEEIKASGRDLNIELADMAGTTSFIIVDPSYGYNAISVAPYAILTGGYVLFADKHNIDEVKDTLSKNRAQSVLVYGFVDEEVMDELKYYSPEIINMGSRYDNNIEIIRKFMQIKPTDQLTLSSGQIIEEGIFTSGNPVLFIGTTLVPDRVVKFVKTSNINFGVLIGNELTRPAKQLKESAGITVFIKFAQGSPTPGTEEFFEVVKGLDLYYLPSLDPEIALAGIRYNIATKTVDVAIENKKDLQTFMKTAISVSSGDQRLVAVGDPDFEVLDGDDKRGFSYEADLLDAIAEQKELTANIYTIYGEAPNFLDKELSEKVPLLIVEKEDECEMDISGVKFDPEIQRLIITAKNKAGVDCFVDANIVDLIIDDEPKTAALKESVLVKKGQTAELMIKQRMTPVDLEDNKQVTARLYYGEDAGFLFKKSEKTVTLQVIGQGINSMYILIGVLAVVIIVAIAWFVKKRR